MNLKKQIKFLAEFQIKFDKKLNDQSALVSNILQKNNKDLLVIEERGLPKYLPKESFQTKV